MWNGVFFFLWLVMLIVINEEKKGFSIISVLLMYVVFLL